MHASHIEYGPIQGLNTLFISTFSLLLHQLLLKLDQYAACPQLVTTDFVLSDSDCGP